LWGYGSTTNKKTVFRSIEDFQLNTKGKGKASIPTTQREERLRRQEKRE
jgi:hypothetical protein